MYVCSLLWRLGLKSDPGRDTTIFYDFKQGIFEKLKKGSVAKMESREGWHRIRVEKWAWVKSCMPRRPY